MALFGESLPDCFVQHCYSSATFSLHQNAIVVSNYYNYHKVVKEAPAVTFDPAKNLTNFKLNFYQYGPTLCTQKLVCSTEFMYSTVSSHGVVVSPL